MKFGVNRCGVPAIVQPLRSKIGLSIGAVTVCCSLCDELTDLDRSENDRQPLALG
jgi:hypothetical protein